MIKNIRILLIDDDEEDYIITRDLIEDIPQRKYKLDWVANYEEALSLFDENKFDVYLVDYKLGNHIGLDIILEAQKKNISAPFILLTGMANIELDEEAMKAGASDYLVKGTITATELDRAIRYSLEHSNNIAKTRSLNHELEMRVAQRTQELQGVVRALELTNTSLENRVIENKRTEEQLRIALEKSKELNELKSRFISMTSHEFRTPLTTILSSTQLLHKYFLKQDPEPFERHIKKIKQSVNNLTELLEYFLSAERLEEGKVLLHPSEFDIVRLFQDHLAEMSDITKPNQTISFLANVPSFIVNFDKKISRTIIQNLVSNAIKYSHENTLIEVSFTASMHDIVFSVSDQGIGIPKDEQEYLFDRFYRAKNAFNIQGTGLGLNIIKKYIDLMHGTLAFNSQLGSGSVFTVSLPLLNPEIIIQ